MTPEEAKKVAEIACQADMECYHCARQLINMCNEAWPEHKEIFEETYKRVHVL